MMAADRESHARQFLAGMILTVAAGTATVWWITGFFLAMAYAGGAASVIAFARLAPSYQPPEPEPDAEKERGIQ